MIELDGAGSRCVVGEDAVATVRRQREHTMASDAGWTRRRTSLVGALVASTAFSLAGCSSTHNLRTSGIEPIERVVGPHDKVTPGGGRYQVGKAYTINGRTYVPREDPRYDAVGAASWYGGDFHHGTRTANGEVYDRTTISAAHPTMPIPSYARVTSLETGRSIIVRVNDRGPYAAGRIIDLSERTAHLLEIKGRGVSKVRVQYVGRAGLAGSDQRTLLASLRGPGLAPNVDDRVLVASADLAPLPRRIPTTATLVADARPATPVNVLAPSRPIMPVSSRALAATQDASSFELAGVDAAGLRAAARERLPKPVATSAEVIQAELPGASGAPMSLMPLPGGDGRYDTSALPVAHSQRASYAAEDRIAGAFARIAEGDALGRVTR